MINTQLCRRKAVLLASAALLAAGASDVAQAHSALAAPAAPDPAPTAAVADAVGSGIADIVVTAQRRNQSAQRVPISIIAANREMLAQAGVINVQNIATLSPSISFTQYNNAASTGNIQIRGIGTVGNSRVFEGAVGVFVDGVYRDRSGQALSNFLDVDDVQILKGAQGTLFGKNTSAGALLINSATPSTDKIKGNFETSYGNFDTYLVRGAINLPVSDKAAIRIAAVAAGTDGNIKDPNGGRLNGSQNWGIKGQFLLEPAPGVRLRLIGDYNKTTGNCCYGAVRITDGFMQPVVNALITTGINTPGGLNGTPYGISTAVPGLGLKTSSSNISDRQASSYPATPNLITDYGAVLNSQFDIGNGKLTSITALRRFSTQQPHAEVDFTAADAINLTEIYKSKFFSQELTYTGELDGGIKAHYLFGGYYARSSLYSTRDIYWGSQGQAFVDAFLHIALSGLLPSGFANADPGLFSSELMHGTDRSLAAFTHWDVDLTSKLGIIAGLRYTSEKKTGSFETTYFRGAGTHAADFFTTLGLWPGPAYVSSTNESAISGTAGLKYQLNHDALLYATYNRGFKAGGVNVDTNGAGTPAGALGQPAVSYSPNYLPETVNSEEIGAKVDWLDGHARTNIAAFYNSISNLQVSLFLGLQFKIINAPSAKVYGAELDQTFKLSHDWTLTGGVTWLPKANFGVTPLLLNLSGRRFSHAPTVAANAALNGEVPVNDKFAVTGRVQLQYQGDIYTNPVTNDTQGSYVLVNANLGIKSLALGWRLEGFINNAFNKTYIESHVNAPLQPGTILGYLGAPRTFGVNLRGSF